MADAVEESLRERNQRLLDDLLRHDQSFYYNNCSIELKERIFKEGILKKLKEFIKSLNEEFKDVHFEYHWVDKPFHLDSQMHKCCGQVYDQEYTDEDNQWNSMYEGNNMDFHFMRTPLQEINLQITYYWERTCNLKCKHRTKRFYIINMPKILDILTFWDLKPPIRLLVNKYIPDFFYDPMKLPAKRGRPRKS